MQICVQQSNHQTPCLDLYSSLNLLILSGTTQSPLHSSTASSRVEDCCLQSLLLLNSTAVTKDIGQFLKSLALSLWHTEVRPHTGQAAHDAEENIRPEPNVLDHHWYCHTDDEVADPYCCCRESDSLRAGSVGEDLRGQSPAKRSVAASIGENVDNCDSNELVHDV